MFTRQAELWFVGPRKSQFFHMNLAGLFPFVGMIGGFLAGLVISFAIDSNVYTSWAEPQRYVPVLLCSGLATLVGFYSAANIIDFYYQHHSPFLEAI